VIIRSFCILALNFLFVPFLLLAAPLPSHTLTPIGLDGVKFKVTVETDWVDVHWIARGRQMNVRMDTLDRRIFTWTGVGFADGAEVTYWFTYPLRTGGLVDTDRRSFVFRVSESADRTGALQSRFAAKVLDARTVAFSYTDPAQWVDFHARAGSLVKNVRMKKSGGIHQDTLNGIPSGQKVIYWFTYRPTAGAVRDTPRFELAMNGSSSAPPPLPPSVPPPAPTVPLPPTPPPAPVPAPPTAGNPIQVPSNVLYLRHGAVPGGLAALAVTPGSGTRHDAAGGTTATQPLAYEIGGLTADHDANLGASSFDLYVEAGGNGGAVVDARVLYDFNGDGQWDRIEDYADEGITNLQRLEHFRGGSGGNAMNRVTGASFQPLRNGRIRIEVWSIRTVPFQVRTHSTLREQKVSRLFVPYDLPAGALLVSPRQLARTPAAYPESVLTSGRPEGRFGGGAAAYTMSSAEISEAAAQGLAAFRRVGQHGSCSGCHAPDGFDLAKFAYSDEDIRRRAVEHVTPSEAEAIVRYVHALRIKHDIRRPLNPEIFRPLQPGLEMLPGATDDDRDRAFAFYLRDSLRLRVATEAIDSEAKAVAAADELRALDLRRLKVGVPFDRWAEDKFHGPSHGTHHGSVAEWLPNMATDPKPSQAGEFYRIFDAYAARPTDEALWHFYDQLGSMTQSHEPAWTGGSGRAYEWMLEKYRSVQVFTHMLRHDTIDLPDRGCDLPNYDLMAYRDMAIARNPIWRVGDVIRKNPLQIHQPDPQTSFPPFVDTTIDPRQEVRRHQSEIIQLAWFWAGWQYDPALLTSDASFETVSGDYFYPINQKYFKVHYAFVLAKLSVEKASAEGWERALGRGTDGHGRWASTRPFLVLKHSTNQRPRPGTGDPRYPIATDILGNTAAMWIFMVDRELRATGEVYDAYGTVAGVEFARRIVQEMHPQRNHAALDAALARIRQLAPQARDLRLNYSTEYPLYEELFQALGIPKN
jgi:hypothetical protein